MARVRRETSPSGTYHIIVRGAGRRLLFEDDVDRRFFIDKLIKRTSDMEHELKLLAWCLMDNHVHLIIMAELAQLEALMRSLNTSFARFYNGRHGHIGPVFQDRYKSIPIRTDAQLLETVRYIHHNPQAAGICDFRDYEWSSYSAYLEGSHYLDANIVFDMLNGASEFIAFHDDAANAQEIMEFATYGSVTMPKRIVMSDGDAIDTIKKLHGSEFANSIASLPKQERDVALTRLRNMGLSVRQIERLTGIGRGIIQKCKCSPAE